MKKSYYNITLDIKGIQSQAVLRVKQFDTSRVIYMSLTDGGKPYTIGEKCYAVFEAIKPDGTKVGNNCYIEKNKIVYEITEQTVAVSGIANCEVSLYDADGGLITSPRFTLIIDRKLVTGDDFQSENEYTSLVDFLQRAEASEETRQEAEDERQAIWNTILDSPNVWELPTGCYRVSGFVNLTSPDELESNVGFPVYDNSFLFVSKIGDERRFVLFLGYCGEFPYDVITGITNGTACEWYGSEGEQAKIHILKKGIGEAGYPSPKAVVDYVDTVTESINADVDTLSNEFDGFNTEFESVKTDVDTLNNDFKSVKTDVDTLSKGGLVLKEDFIGEQVNSWLDEHPEATTTVQDGSLTSDKMNPEFKAWIRSNTINVKDFGAVGDGVTNDTQALKTAFAVLGDYGNIVLPKGHYIVKPTANKQSLIKLTGLKGITIDLNGSTLEVATNGYPEFNLFELVDCENFVITNGILKGDRLTHDYKTTAGTHAFGYGVFCKSSLNYWLDDGGTPSDTLKCGGKISNCEIYNFTGDGIVTKNGMSPDTIKIENCTIHHCRRQGVSILDSDTVILDNCHIHHIGTFDGINGASPMSGIDIEPDSGTLNVNSVVIKNTIIEDITRDSIISGAKYLTQKITLEDGTTKVENIGVKTTVKEIIIDNCRTGVLTIGNHKNKNFPDEEFTPVFVKNSVLNHNIVDINYRSFAIYNGIISNCEVNIAPDYDYTNKDIFTSRKLLISNSVINLSSEAVIRYVEIENSTINGGTIRIVENDEFSTMKDCHNVIFNNSKFNIGVANGLYKFVGCSFRSCTPFAISKPLVKFRNCYLDSKYVPGADYVNCIIEDEIGAEA